MNIKCELYNDHFQNFKRYHIPKAQLVIADIPYNLGNNAYASSNEWYVDGKIENGESKKANSTFFDTDENFKIAEFMHFCSKMLIKEPKEKGKAPCMIVFCSFQQLQMVIDYGKKHGFNNYIPLVFIKKTSAQVLKANMKIVGATEYGLVLYREKLPKFNNYGKMITNWFHWEVDNNYPKLHPCLPTGEKILINNEWINIEDAKIGDMSNYGRISDVTSHLANKIVTINTKVGKVKATYNHPFLVKNGNSIMWKEAEQLCEQDYLLISLRQQIKDILEPKEMENLKWNILERTKSILDMSQKVIKSTTSMELKQIIELKTSLLSAPLNTSGCTLIAKLEKGNGINGARLVEGGKNAQKITGIIQEIGLAEENAKNVTLVDKYKTDAFVLSKVENVEIQEKDTTVHNLSIDGIPAFDTKIGVTHNTQKPIPLLKQLISIFTDYGDVVIDPVAGSGSSLRAAVEMNRHAYGFEIKKDFCAKAKKEMLTDIPIGLIL